MLSCRKYKAAWLANCAALAVALLCATPFARADAQRDPELRGIVARAIASAECFPDKFDSAIWYTLMEPKLRRVVKALWNLLPESSEARKKGFDSGVR